MKTETRRVELAFVAGLLLSQSLCVAQSSMDDRIAATFDAKHGQLEIGGNYVGAEFHNSFPLPSRISFYHPVANSIDLSTDYWRRDESKPFTITLSVGGKTDTIGYKPFVYRWTPYNALFEQTRDSYKTEISYHFCEDLPVMVFQIKIQNILKEKKEFRLVTKLNSILRTCQSYTVKDSARVTHTHSGSVAIIDFDESDTDSAQVFVANVGEPPIASANQLVRKNLRKAPEAAFEYKKILKPYGELVIIQLIGSCRQTESKEILGRSLQNWKQSVKKYEQRISQYVWDRAAFVTHDASLDQTTRWSKAILAANLHFINGHIVPMPCPAEYNFYFTHDVLLTNLGAVLFDTQRVKDDLLFLHTLSKADSILPHAYYWRDDGFKTEFCGSDNWNHLWFIILAGSYLKHSGDTKTVALLYPIIKKSLMLMLRNKGTDGLMYASRPDWWDIGNVYGARSYITTLMIRALREFSFISVRLGIEKEAPASYLQLAKRMKEQLVKRLWDEKASYLLNMIDAVTVDKHYYSGSLLATAFDILDSDKKKILLETAQRELLDENLGIRNVMPADFHELIDVYKFKGMEAGGPYIYANGGVWPQGTIWYAMGLLSAKQPNVAKNVIKKYLTLEGISKSPNGQPSFFEFRNADVRSLDYGKIDKPTFLWAAGWYIYALYHLCGARENEWNISFNPNLPDGFENSEYDLMINGKLSRVSWKGKDNYFKNINADGKKINSAVLYSIPEKIILERGTPELPYLANASCIVDNVEYSISHNSLHIDLQGIHGQPINLKVISPLSAKKVLVDSVDRTNNISVTKDTTVYIINLQSILDDQTTTIIFQF